MSVKLIRAKAAAEILGCSSLTVRRMIRDRHLTGHKRPGAGANSPWLFDQAEVEALVAKMAVGPLVAHNTVINMAPGPRSL